MKKRLLSALLALALVFVLLPTTALAGEVTTNGDISIAGKGWNFTKSTSGYETVYYQVQSNNGVFSTSLDNETGCVWPTNPYLEITRTGNTITVIVHNEVTITTNKGTNNAAEECIEVNKSNNQTTTLNLVIKGAEGTTNNTLTLECKGYGSALSSYQGGITITGGVIVNAKSTYTNSSTGVSARAINVFNGDLTISGTGTTVNAENKDRNHPTIDVKNAVTISDGATLTAKNTSGDKAISFGSITADGYDFKYWTTNGYTTLTGEDKATNIQTYSRIRFTPTVIQKDNYVYIAGGPAVVGVRTSLGEGNGYYTYNKDTKTFTLENVNITSVINAIQLMADGTYTINLVGTNTISDVSAGIVASNLYGANDITAVLSGTGSLDITAGHYAIDMQKVGNLKFENTGTIKLTTGYKYPASTCNALYVVGNVTIDKTKYDIKGEKQAQGFPTEDIGNSPVFETILKGTSTDKDLYFKSITIAPKSSETYYNDKAMKYGETRPAGSGTISCDENGVITLSGATAGTLEFRSSADSTLVLEGTSTLSSIVTTQKGLTISGSGSLTVGSIRVTNNDNISADLTINGGAHVTVGTAELTTRAIDIKGDLTVMNGSLTATSNSDNVPTVQVGGNASFTGSTVTITNNSTALHKDAADTTKGDSVSSALYVKGNINTDNAKVTAKVENGGGNAIGAVGNITVNGSTVTAVNKGQKFTTIIAENVYVSGDSKITANNLNENPVYNGSYLAFPAIEGNIVNQNTDYSLKFKGQHNGTSEPKTTLAPGEQATLSYYNVTITRGDEVARTESPVVIAGTTLLNDTYYTITNGSKVAEGTDSNYNAFYDSETKTLKLNNAQISHSFANENSGGRDGAIIFKEFENYFIELSGENTISSTNTYAINCHRPDRTLTIKNAAEAENAKLTLTSNWMVICSIGGLNIQSDVTMVNTKEAGYLMYVNDTFSFDGYNAYASVNASGSPLVEYTVPTSGDKDAGYQYLRITKETLETGGGSTHQHTYGGWKSDATYHWQECTDPNCPDPTKGITNKASHIFSNGACTVCGYRGQTEEHHFGTEWISDEEYHWHKCTDEGCDAISGKAPHEWTGWLVNDDRPEVHAQRCNCGYLGSTHSTLKYVAINGEQHQKQCPVDGCGYKIESSTTAHVYAEGSNICTDCGYNKSAPCDHTGDRAYTNNGDGTHKVTCKACGATIVEKQSHEFGPTGACIYCGATQSGGDPTPDNPGTIVIIRPAEEEKPAQQPNPSTGANDLVGLAVAAAVAAALGSAALLRKHD